MGYQKIVGLPNNTPVDALLMSMGNGDYAWINGRVLPSVTTADNGKLLMVVNGAWAASSIPNSENLEFPIEDGEE